MISWNKPRIGKTIASWKQWRALKQQRDIKLELGSGEKNGTNGWTTVDTAPCDFRYDLRNGIPLPDNSVSALYASHFLEHLSYKDLCTFIPECHRVLKSGGTFSVCVPNFRLFIEAYMENREFEPKEGQFQPAVVSTGSNMDQINYIAYMNDEHKYMFDQENLLAILKKGGFETVEKRGFDPELDLAERDYQSIYALATKA
jgi:predicted SAM-dependent methyltransferase